jgi:hypothetical protein
MTLRPPGVSDLACYCGVMVDTLWRQGLVREVVILVDDVDLLEGYQSPDHNGQRERSILADALTTRGFERSAPVVAVRRCPINHDPKCRSGWKPPLPAAEIWRGRLLRSDHFPEAQRPGDPPARSGVNFCPNPAGRRHRKRR